MGINMRTTMDIDANITGMNFEKDEINEMIDDILSIKIDDNVIFEVEKNVPIKEDNEYGGYRFKLIAKLSNLKIPFSITTALFSFKFLPFKTMIMLLYFN